MSEMIEHGQPPFPEVPPTLDLGGFSAKLLHDFDRFSSGKMLLRISDSEARIMSGEEEVGTVGFSGIIYVESGKRLWKIDTLELFRMVQQAEKDQYLEQIISSPAPPGGVAGGAGGGFGQE